MTSVSTHSRPRKQRAADAAIEVIADSGLRGLTHRAVDARAGLPEGSTSSCFRTRFALLSGVVDRLVELEETWAAQFPTSGWAIVTSDDIGRIVDVYTELLLHWLGPARSRTVARLELYLEGARRPELVARLDTASRYFIDMAAAGMREVGIPDPQESARVLVAQLDGLIFSAVTRPLLGGTDRESLRQSVLTVLRGFLP
ncbi:TetR/AcrR family transcriptional regulator [Actinoalloteichus hymeniacidonis]|nr:TetR/AcrR family transcriptional regulator [Actinoalloteichus hymeniacidonis]MBB5906936.1 AcrR family transcriptional regulator [Actinoalloteichus hymeniacidonis]